jgi:hypothetical protein
MTLDEVTMHAFYDEIKKASVSINIPTSSAPLIPALMGAAWRNKGNLALMGGGALMYHHLSKAKNKYDTGAQLQGG